jgi:hypothetical protein
VGRGRDPRPPAARGVPAGGGEAAAAGLEILILGPDGRIEADYQFIEA